MLKTLPLRSLLCQPVLRLAARLFAGLMLWWAFAMPAMAATCGAATGQGSGGPPDWQSYCWIDMSSYNDATARSSSGQPFSITLADGSTVTFTLKIIATNAAAGQTALNAVASPSWGGSAFGNTSFTGIPNRPILYTAAFGLVSTVEISNIVVTPPAGGTSQFAFVVADGESTGGDGTNNEQLIFTTDGGGWSELDRSPSPGGSLYPTLSGLGTGTATITGNSNSSYGAYVLGSTTPTRITANIKPTAGLQGALFAIRFASISLTKTITRTRAAAADQFTFRVRGTTSGTTLASGTTSGTALGPFNAAVLQMSAGSAITVDEVMAAGSTSTLAAYDSRLTCVNNTAGSSTPMPTNVQTTSYNLGMLAYGDSVACTFTNTPYARVTLNKAMGSGGRQFSGDQFIMSISHGGTTDVSTTTTGSNSNVNNGSVTLNPAVGGTSYTLAEAASGSTVLTQYTATIACTNSLSGSSTVLPTSVPGTFTPQPGDMVTCTITNTKKGSNALLVMTKTSNVISDPVNGSSFPRMMPGAVVRYTITVTNTGPSSVDSGSVVITDPLPANVTYDATTGIGFVNGTSPASGLTGISRSYSSAAGGGTPYTYTPSAGYDTNVTGLRVSGTGTMAGSTGASSQPSFSITYQVRIN